MPLFAGLQSGGPKPPRTLFHRLLTPLAFLLANALLTVAGLPWAVVHQITHPNPFKLVSPWAWRDLVLQYGFGALLNAADIQHRALKAPLVALAHGRVLEVGAGSGLTIKYYNPDKVTELVAVEPFAELRTELEKVIKAAKLKKATVIPDGIDDPVKIASQGVTESSFDTVVLVQVLCSVPNPKEQIAFLHTLLKPGGQLLLFEHVGSKDTITRLVQRFFRPYWLFATTSCDLVRDSGDWVVAQGGWEKVELEAPSAEDATTLLPHAVGRFVKA
ncbi:unnamed protein product [Tilletia controversa]|uniref:Methyltransferase type 11 domain-containing protein n=2 Tax=Tilletia TaxID=13289 RepID=A0A9N8MAG6_9BASI|nr:hypothetical protein CF328_g8219 [Tilletia controversa]CAD6885770.1 unnamed protein product [Tilletia caries]CAD6954574.1 unnamed protein product [Tilletia laevis]CAD6907556.1 unnamed protein product [Tilletia controversa]CAD6930102.1 unnamed protein product [Tilletia controversa]